MPKNKRRRKKKPGPPIKTAPGAVDLDNVFCVAAKKYKLDKIFLKSIAIVESSLDPRAYRYEPKFWDRYLADHNFWKTKDPKEVSASYGLMQIMYVVAHELGFTGKPEDLYNPMINVMLAAKLLKKHFDYMKENPKPDYWPFELALAWYNGGRGNNPDETGRLRNPEYLKKVKAAQWQLLKEGDEVC